MEFEWDSAKAERNVRKHGVSFHEAAEVFLDPLSMTYYDPDHSADESRFVIRGMSVGGRCLVVAHAVRNQRIRVISAREMTRMERRQYEEPR